MKVLITGAAGNLGAKLTSHLAGHVQLVLIDLSQSHEVHAADLSRLDDSWISLFRDVDCVVHLAGNPVAYHDWPDLIGPNVDAMLNVFHAAALHQVKRVVFASSNHVMGGYQMDPRYRSRKPCHQSQD